MGIDFMKWEEIKAVAAERTPGLWRFERASGYWSWIATDNDYVTRKDEYPNDMRNQDGAFITMVANNWVRLERVIDAVRKIVKDWENLVDDSEDVCTQITINGHSEIVKAFKELVQE